MSQSSEHEKKLVDDAKVERQKRFAWMPQKEIIEREPISFTRERLKRRIKHTIYTPGILAHFKDKVSKRIANRYNA